MTTANDVPPRKRKRVNTKHPNPLFEKWLTEWRDAAKEKGSQLAFTFGKAITTLRKYPLPLQSGKECGILKNFGTRLCVLLDRKLAEHRAANPAFAVAAALPAPPVAAKKPRAPAKRKAPATSAVTSDAASDPQPAKKPAAAAAARKGPSKAATASSSGSLPADAGSSSAAGLATVPSTKPAIPVVIPSGAVQVRMLVDCGETSKGSKKASKVATMKELNAQKIPFDIRSLSVGDFVWVASYGGHELVLPFVVERKRTDDLAQSIKDKRYYEQKWRLKATGFRVIYLIETINCHTCLPIETLNQAETNTEINDKFCVHKTFSVKDTVTYLATMTRLLQRKFQNKTLVNCGLDHQPEYSLQENQLCLYTLKEFNDGAAKIENFTVREMFAQQLLQISGASVDAVCAIVEQFPTPALLRQAFAACHSNPECLGLLTALQFGSLKRRLPLEVARRIWLFYTAHDFSSL